MAPLAEQVAIRSVAERYFFAADTGDAELMLSCFADPFRFELHLDPTVVISSAEGLRALLKGFSPPAASNHGLSNMRIMLAGDGATSTIHATAHLYMAASETVMVRGLRYRDEWVKTNGAWRIAKRIHEPRWQFNAASVPPKVARQ